MQHAILATVSLIALVQAGQDSATLPAAPETEPEEGQEREGSDLVELRRCPNEGIQPSVTLDGLGRLHLIYVLGDLAACDLFYARSKDSGETWSDPLRVNGTDGGVDASGTMRAPAIAVDSSGLAHVVWVGADGPDGPDGPDGMGPLHYARLSEDRSSFEPELELDTNGTGVSAAAAVTIGLDDTVHVFWHGPGETTREDAVGRVYHASCPSRAGDGSKDASGASPGFAPTRAIDEGHSGASESCAMSAGTDAMGRLFVFYRTLRGKHRDMRFLVSEDGGVSYKGVFVDNWKRQVCPRSTAGVQRGPRRLYATWEARGEVYFAQVQESTSRIFPPYDPGKSRTPVWRTRPAIAMGNAGTTVLTWLEGERDREPEALRFIVFHNFSRRSVDRGRLEGELPAGTVPTAFARPDGTYVVLY